ncbi:MAG: hypothetical protein ACW98D_19535 [Promethearchaeota archaeon]|jgi:hypothetical protein
MNGKNNCCNDDFLPVKKIWTSQGSLQPSAWSPWGWNVAVPSQAPPQQFKEGYCGSCGTQRDVTYPNFALGWSAFSNVTPRGSACGGSGQKENFVQVGMAHNSNSPYGSYSRLGQTWTQQKPFNIG